MFPSSVRQVLQTFSKPVCCKRSLSIYFVRKSDRVCCKQLSFEVWLVQRGEHGTQYGLFIISRWMIKNDYSLKNDILNYLRVITDSTAEIYLFIYF